MDIDFNNVRVQAIHSFNRLVTTLNKSIEPTVAGWKKVEVSVSDIEEDINDLRQLIGAIACTFHKDDPDFKMVYTDDIHMQCFNEEE